IPNYFTKKEDEKIYLSGDLGKLLPNGEVQCFGRKDHQVKIRGHRIELGEIEAVLDAIPEVKRSAVVVTKDFGNEPRLAAYLQARANVKDTTSIRDSLYKLLPDFMIPSFFMWLDEFPITS